MSNSVTVSVSERPKAAVIINPDNHVFRGDSVTLTCNIENGGGVQNWRYSWNKDGSGLYVRNKQYSIDSVTENHAGKYTCTGTETRNSRSSLTSDDALLTVSERPKPIVSINPDNHVFIGDSVTLTCNIENGGGVQNWRYSWNKDRSRRSVSNKQYRISSVTIADAGKYTCTGTETGGSRSSHPSAAVLLTVSGQTVTLTCNIEARGGDQNYYSYSWNKDKSGLYVRNKQYSIDSVTENHAGKYTCTGTVTGSSRSSLTSDDALLTVSAKPKPTMRLEPQNFIYTGDTVTLTCDLNQSTGWTFIWFRNDQQVNPQISADKITTNKISEKLSNAGTTKYNCIARRGNYYSEYSDLVTVTVEERPKAAVNINPGNHVFRGDSVTLTCNIENGGGVQNWSYSWNKGSDQTVSNRQHYRISDVTGADAGKYTCTGTETGGSRSSHPSSVRLTVSVPKTAHPRELNDFRPVALTSHLMKTLERIILNHLRPIVDTTLDPLQFAYKTGIGVEDAVIHLLHRSLSHLDTPGNTVRVMFFDFSSTFNTLQPSLLGKKLEVAGVDRYLTTWMIDYLSNRPQYVRLQDCVSNIVVSSTGAPQGTVLSPFLFSVYTSDFQHNTQDCFLQTFSDDTAIVGCLSDGNEQDYRSIIKDFVTWCELNVLHINTSKTKELVIDFRKKSHHTTPVCIQGLDIEMVNEYKYLGVHLNNKLDWSSNSDALYRKGQSRLHLQRRLRSFGVCRPLLRSFYDTVVASAIFYGVVCWGERPKPTVIINPDNHVFRGEIVTLTCNIVNRGGVRNWSYSWKKGGSVVSNDQQYRISDVTENHAGKYTCTGTETGGSRSSHPSDAVLLTVSEKPKPELTSNHKVAALAGNLVLLYCELNQTAGWNFYWYKHTQNTETETTTHPSYTIYSVSVSDGGQYWCRAGRGNPVYYTHYSTALWVNVTDGDVILESPVHPVTEGESLTLHCLYRKTKPSNLRADFYKDGSVVQNQTSGEMMIHHVSKSDEGFYHCKYPEGGESPKSLVLVRVSKSVATIIGVAVGLSSALLLLVLICAALMILLCCCKKNKGSYLGQRPTVAPLCGLTLPTFPIKIPSAMQHDSAAASSAAHDQKDTAPEPSDVTYAEIDLKPKKKQKKSKDAVRGANDVLYSDINLKDLKTPIKDAAAEPSDMTYAEIDLKPKKPKISKGKKSVGADTMYLKLKQNTDKGL
ncbi:uncharacterized protein LOC134311986 [Trichomycterus rosablanca]|uniref:uncharacterized protein LOC134311986 n=1 Tax=Trichomycterus rosablanca TaxID=2290929 RepID=UPI002F35FF71